MTSDHTSGSWFFSSIKNRILVFVVVFELLAYSTIQLFNNVVYKQALSEQKNAEIRQTFAASVEKINNISQLMERNVIDLANYGEQLYRQKQQGQLSMAEVSVASEKLLVNNFDGFAEAIGGGLWYEPYSISPELHYFGPYVFRSNGKVQLSWDLNTPEYDYHNQDWYRIAKVDNWGKHRDQPHPIYWTEPYYDAAASFSLMMTVDAVMFDEQGEAIGMATVDWALQHLTTFLDKVKLSTNAYPFFIFQGDGKFLSYPKDKSKVLQPASEFEWGRILLGSRTVNHLKMLENIVVDGEVYDIYYYRTPRGFIFGSMMPVKDMEQSIARITDITLVAGLGIGAVFIVIMLLLMRVLFTPFDKVLALIKGSIKRDESGTVSIQPMHYPAHNEFTPLINALGEVYQQVNSYVNEISCSKEAIEHLNEELERKVEFRTEQLERKTSEAVVALEDLKRTQEQLIKTEKHAALGRLVAGVAHEINTPLGVAVTAASCIEKEFEHLFEMIETGRVKRSKVDEHHHAIIKGNAMLKGNLARATDLIASFKLVAADQTSDEPRRFSVAEYINQVVLSLEPAIVGPGFEVKVNCDDELELYSQPGALAQIITNLIDNALRHGLSGKIRGTITINIQRREEYTVIEVGDDGKGIREDIMGYIFDPFYTTNRQEGCSGLGLHLVYNLVTQQLGGNIHCDSRPGQGTTFTISLPDLAAES